MRREHHPPKWIYHFMEKYCDPYLWEGISGDLEEVFRENVDLKGPWKARWIYLFQSIGFLRAKFKKKNKRTSNMKSIWINYFLTAFRSIKKHKALFGINLIGLVMAISCSLFALIYIHDELQFDNFHSQKDQIYRLYKRHINVAEQVDHLTYETSGMMGPTMTQEYPEVESFVRILPSWHKIILSYEEKNITTEKMHFADSNFFEVFDFKVLQGNPSNLLTAPSSIVLSRSLATKMFGDETPIGKVLVGMNELDYTVTGIFEDPPRQSSLQPEAIVSWTTTVPDVGPLNMRWMNNWLAQGIYTFVKLSEGASPEVLTDKLPDMMNRHFEERAEQYFLKLQNLPEMYLYGDDIKFGRGMKVGSITFVYTLGFSALLIFLIASVNYINIALSRASQTQTEVGIRKVMGSSRRQLIGRFISETLFSTLLASAISYLLIYLMLPYANAISGKELPTSSLFQPISLGAISVFIFATSLMVGLYPAMIMSSPPISTILKASAGVVGSTGWFRKVLLTLQYSISIFLIICTAVVIKQTSYLENKPLGFDKEQILVLDLDNEIRENIDVLESRMLSHPNISSVSISRSVIGGGSYSTTVLPDGYESEMGARIFGVDQEFFETYGIAINSGRTFLKGSTADSNNLVINQAFADFLGWEDAIGKRIRFSPEGQSYPIIGVINDFHIHSLASSNLQPMVLHLNTVNRWYASVRIGNGSMKETISFLNDNWDELAGRTPFDFYFVDEWFNEQYEKERQLLKISSFYSIISILLCALGLYGLTALLLQQRTKEISIRKVLGAPLSSIISMMNKQFLIIIGISFIIAAPLAHYLVSDWLQQFAYRTSLSISPFALSGGMTLLVSILIVSGLSIKTANVNPSQNLSSE